MNARSLGGIESESMEILNFVSVDSASRSRRRRRRVDCRQIFSVYLLFIYRTRYMCSERTSKWELEIVKERKRLSCSL